MAANNFYRTPYLTTISFASGILLFFLPFMEIKCGGTTLAQMSGKDMVFGSEPKMGDEFKNLGDQFNKTTTTTTTDNTDGVEVKTTTKTEKKGKAYIFAIVALALGVIGLIISLVKKGVYNKTEMFAGALGALALIALMIHVKIDVNSQMETGKKETDELSSMMKISVDFTIWFFMCVLAYMVAAFFSYKQKELVSTSEVPPANAPQLHIQNPGDQSDFPAAATGDKDLG